jgi:protein-disulfide isomerase
MLAAVFAVGAGWLASSASAQRAVSEPELDEFEQRVRDYLLKNPEVIMEALQVLQERQRAAEAEDLKGTIAERSAEILNDPAAPVGGNPSGDITLVEFFDYNCPYCRRVAPTVTALIEDDPNLRLVYKEFPILGPGSQFAARAALASRAQGKYLAFHETLMDAGQQVNEDSVIEIARAVPCPATNLPTISSLVACRASSTSMPVSLVKFSSKSSGM